jgi:hypothetical protein
VLAVLVAASWLPPSGTSAADEISYEAIASTADSKQPDHSLSCQTSGTFCEFPDVLKGRRYFVEVSASIGSSKGEATKSAEVRVPAPPEPVANVVTQPGDRQVAIGWDAPTDDGGLSIERYLAKVVGSGQSCETVDKSCVLHGLERGETYEVEVSAFNSAGASAAVRTNTGKLPNVPKPVAGLKTESFTYLDTSNPELVEVRNLVTVVWEPAEPTPDSGPVEYLVELLPGEAFCKTYVPNCVFAKGIEPGANYQVRVTSSNALGSATSVLGSVVEIAVPPSLVQNLSVEWADHKGYLNSEKLIVSWDPPLDDGGTGIIGYVAESIPNGERCIADAAHFPTDEGKVFCEFTGVDMTPGTEYSIVVAAVSGAGLGAVSQPIDVRVIGRPSIPRNLSAEYVDGSIVVDWTPPAETGGVPVVVYSVTGNHSWANCIARNTTTCRITSDQIKEGETYTLVVRAINVADGESSASKAFDLTIPNDAYRLSTVKARVQNREMTVFWEPPPGASTRGQITYQIDVNPGRMSCQTTLHWCLFKNVEEGKKYEVSARVVKPLVENRDPSTILVSGTYVRSTEVIGESCTPATKTNNYLDVPSSSELSQDLGCLLALGIVSGDDGIGGDNKFQPGTPMRRSEFASLVAGFWKSTTGRTCGVTTSNKTYRDVAQSNPHSEAIACLTGLGVVHGTAPGQFSPDRLITRAEASVMVRKIFEAATRTRCRAPHSFSDVPKLSFYSTSVNCLRSKQLVNGTSETTFSPFTALNRQQGTALVARTFRLVLTDEYSPG